MRYKPFGLAVALFFLLNSCSQQGATENKNNTVNEPAATVEVKEQQSANVAVSGFDINKIPLSEKEIGEFPYLAPPEGYEYSLESKRNYEEKFFYYDDSLVRRVSGNYFYSSVRKKKDNADEYGKTFVLKSYEDSIKNLGGVLLYTGSLPDQANKLVEKEKPAFFKDLSTNFAISYKQYILRTAEANIWFELATIDNEYEIRLSVIREAVAKQ